MAIKCDPVGSELHGLGSSINCLGRRVTSYTTRDAKEIAKLPAKVVIVGCSECGFGTINSYERNCQVRSCGICRYCPLRGSSCRAVSAAVFAWGHALFSFEQLGQKTLVPIVILSAPASSLTASDVFHPATRFMLTAWAAASVREEASIFSSIFRMWSLTVSSETPTMSAISLFENPLAIRFSISS